MFTINTQDSKAWRARIQRLLQGRFTVPAALWERARGMAVIVAKLEKTTPSAVLAEYGF